MNPALNIAIIQVPLTWTEINQLGKEFPKLLFLPFPRHALQPINKEHWRKAEVLFGEKLSCEDLQDAPLLRWIHTPTENINKLCIKDINKRGNILISTTREENTYQIAEYVLSVILAFAKNLFQWKETDKSPVVVWDSKWRNSMWTLKDKIFLQIGMGKAGIEIANRAHEAGMKVYTMDKVRTFHPYSIKQLNFDDLSQILPTVDIVSLTLSKDQGLPVKLGKDELTLMKDDSILSILGPSKSVDEDALHELALTGKFRGILLDSPFQLPIPPQSKLWDIPQLLLTPDVAPRPKTTEREAFRLFRYNLRQFLHGNYGDMKNILDPSIAYIPDEIMDLQ